MFHKFCIIFISICLLHIQRINCALSSCKHYVNEYSAPQPLDICTSQSIKGIITSTKTVCDSGTGFVPSTTIIRRTFSGSDCSDRYLQSQEMLTTDKVSEPVCAGDICAVSLRNYLDDDCDGDYVDTAFLRGVVYSETSQCTLYDCTYDEDEDTKVLNVQEIDCESQIPYVQTVYWEDINNCQLAPLYCASHTATATTHEPVVLLPGLPSIISQTEGTIAVEGTIADEGHIETAYIMPHVENGGDEDDEDELYSTQGTNEELSVVERVRYEIIYTLPAIPTASICLTVVLMILFGLTYFLYFDEDTKQQMEPMLKLFVILSITFNVLSILCIMTVCIMMQTMLWNEATYNSVLVPYYGSVIGYVGGKFCLESFFLQRVYLAFQGSLFRISKRFCIFLYAVMIIISVMWLIILILDDENLHFGYMIIWALESLFIVTLLGIFTNGLHKLIVQSSLELNASVCSPVHVSSPGLATVESTTRGADNSTYSLPAVAENADTVSPQDSVSRCKYICCIMRANNVRSAKKDSNRLNLIYLMTRCVLLSSISLVTTAVFGVFLSLQSQIDVQSIYILYAIWSIDITINSCCLFLNFRFTDVFYKKCCNLCHRSCQSMLEYVSGSKVVHNAAVRSLSNLKSVKSISVE